MQRIQIPRDKSTHDNCSMYTHGTTTNYDGKSTPLEA